MKKNVFGCIIVETAACGEKCANWLVGIALDREKRYYSGAGNTRDVVSRFDNSTISNFGNKINV